MSTLLKFLNDNPVGVALKVAVVAVLSLVLTNLPTFDLSPYVAVGVTPILVALIDYFNPLNPRFGMGS